MAVLLPFALIGLWALGWVLIADFLRRTQRYSSRILLPLYTVLTTLLALPIAVLFFVGLRRPVSGAVIDTAPFVACLIGILCGATLWALLWLLERVKVGSREAIQNRFQSPHRWLLVLSGASEEVLFRLGLLVGFQSLGIGTPLSVFLSSSVFGLAHYFQGGWWAVVLHSCTGAVFGTVFVLIGPYAAVTSHCAYNLCSTTRWSNVGSRRQSQHPAAQTNREQS